MVDDQIINFRIKSAQEMQVLGKAFAACFLAPLIFPDDAPPYAPVVSLYGSPGSGKTEFSIGVIDLFNNMGLGLSLFEEKRHGDLLFRHADLGHCFYWDNECTGFFEKIISGRRWLTSTGGQVLRTKIKAKGFDLFEHASLSHLLLPSVGVTIIIGYQAVIHEAPFYLVKMERTFQKAAAHEGLRKVSRWLGKKPKENKIASSILPQIHVAKELIVGMSEGSEQKRQHRIVSMNLNAPNVTAQRAFDVFGQQAARFSYP